MSSLVIFYHTYVRWRIIICFVVPSSQASLMSHFSFLAAKSISHSPWFCMPASSGFLLAVHLRTPRPKAPFLRSAHSRPDCFSFHVQSQLSGCRRLAYAFLQRLNTREKQRPRVNTFRKRSFFLLVLPPVSFCGTRDLLTSNVRKMIDHRPLLRISRMQKLPW